MVGQKAEIKEHVAKPFPVSLKNIELAGALCKCFEDSHNLSPLLYLGGFNQIGLSEMNYVLRDHIMVKLNASGTGPVFDQFFGCVTVLYFDVHVTSAHAGTS